MQEVLNDTHDQEDHGESQTANGQHTQEGQTGVGSIEHRDQVSDSFGDPAANGVEDSQDGIENSSSLQKHSLSILSVLFISTVDQAVAYMVAATGIEPVFPAAKTGVLPLDEAAI